MKFSFGRRFAWAKHKTRRRAMQLPPAWQAIWWMVLGGIMFSLLNTIARTMALQMDPFEAQFLRYLCGLLVILPLVLRSGMSQGFKTFWPTDVKGQFWRGAVHTVGLMLWFIALPKIPLADMTAISFTGPIFIMMGASFFLNEPMHRDRWIAALIGFAGPRVIEQTIREKLPEGFQRAEFLKSHGMVDMVVHRHEMKVTIARLCRILTKSDKKAA